MSEAAAAEQQRVPLCDGNSLPILGLGTCSLEKVVKGETVKAVKAGIEIGYRHLDGAFMYGNEDEVGEAIRAKITDGTVKREDIFYTSKTAKDACYHAMKVAIDVGYRHFDGAWIYGNEDEIGKAIQEKMADGTVRRDEIYYCGKLWSTCHLPEMVRPALEKSLKRLKFDYIDLYIIELPLAFKLNTRSAAGRTPPSVLYTEINYFQPGDVIYPRDENGKYLYHPTDLCATWEALEVCKDAGLVKSIGVSNFNRRQLEQILNKPGLKYKPAVNQVECHPYFTQLKLKEFCDSHGIVIVGYSPLGTCRDSLWVNIKIPPLLDDPVLNSVATKYKKTSAQVALRFQIQRNVVVIPKSFNPERIKQNFEIFDFSLTSEEMKMISALNRNERYVKLSMWSDHPEYPFNDEY